MSNRPDLGGETLRARMALLSVFWARGGQSLATEVKYSVNGSRFLALAEAAATIAGLPKPLMCDGKPEGSAFVAIFKAISHDQVRSHNVGVGEQLEFVRTQLERVKPTGMDMHPDSPVLFGRNGERILVLLKDLEDWLREYALRQRTLSIGRPPPGSGNLGLITIAPPASITGFHSTEARG